MPAQERLFHELFDAHLKSGTHAGQTESGIAPTPWLVKLFARKIGVEQRIVGYWRTGGRVPDKDNLEAFCDVLFGNNPLHRDAREELHAAWLRALNQRKRPGRKPPAGDTAQPAQPAAAWVPEEPFTLRDGLARLYIHRNQGQAPGGQIALDVTVEAGRRYLTIDETEDTPKVSTTFAVSAAEIVVVKDLNVEVVPGTTLGS
jgi:hypothetical protein